MSVTLQGPQNWLTQPAAADPNFYGNSLTNLNTYRNQLADVATQKIYQRPDVVDPTTGVVDQGRLNALVSQDPNASWKAAQIMQQQGQAQQAQATAQSDQTAARLAQLKVMSGEMSDLLQSGQPITADLVHTRLNSLGKEGILTTPVMNYINDDLNSQPPGADLTGWVRNHMAANLSAAEQLQNVTSQPQTQDMGDRHIVVEGNPNMPGGRRIGTSYVQGQPPSVAGDLVTVNYSDGTSRQMPKSQAQALYGANYASIVIPGSAPKAGQPATPASGGRYTAPPGAQTGTQPASSGGAGGPSTATQPPAPAQPNAMGGRPVAGQPGMFTYPNGKIGGAPDANGGVQFQDGSYATPGGGFRPPVGATTGTGTGAADSGPYVVGDSLAQGVQQAGKFDGNTQLGRSPQAVLQTMTDPKNPLPISGKDVVISSGAANNSSQAGYLQQQIDAANKQGAKSVTVMGTADPVTNRQLQAIATAAGARFVPIGAVGPDGVHPLDYRPLVGAVRPPAAAATTAGQTTTAAQPPPPGPVPGLTIPGVGAAATAAAEGSAQDQVAFRRDLPAAQGRIFTAQQALQALEASKTGAGTGWLQAANSVIGSYEPAFLKNILGPSYDPATLATNRDLAEKYLTQIAMANASKVGPGTDAKLAAAFTGNPNTHIQNLAAQDVLKVQIGLDRMQQAQGDDMQTQGPNGGPVPPQDFANWRQNWVRTHDPRAFVMDSMSPDQLNALKASLQKASPQEKSIFRNSVEQASAGGHISMPIPTAPTAPAGG